MKTFARTGLLIVPTMLAAHAFATDYPVYKEGLWESTTTLGTSAQSVKTTVCKSHATDALIQQQTEKAAGANPACKASGMQHQGSVYTDEVECRFPDRTTTTKHVLTMTGDTAYHLESVNADGTVQTKIDSKYVGACPAGMKPGDVVMANGMKMNVLDTGGDQNGGAQKGADQGADQKGAAQTGPAPPSPH